MNVCVTGATGFVGRGVVPVLLKAGHTLRVLVRNEGSLKSLPQEPTIQAVLGDATSYDALVEAIKGCDAVVHLVGIRRREIQRRGSSYEAVDVESVRQLIKACTDADVRRVIVLSAASLGNSVYVQAKKHAEQLLRDSTLQWTILKPSFIVGPGQQWPVILHPILEFLAMMPGRIGSIGKRAGNVSREQLACAIARALVDPTLIGQALDVPEIRECGTMITR